MFKRFSFVVALFFVFVDFFAHSILFCFFTDILLHFNNFFCVLKPDVFEIFFDKEFSFGEELVVSPLFFVIAGL